ncbi:tetratricopeptide repeat 1 (TTC1) [Fusarium beomiforme]|uniref:Tetratricopeptide repeat 1 (TTC1) n=1 Tax=Fusarium beomiforme TaxID=44412 RepID=A0A9P5AMB1_9HYPO|nr:tetratricopeptide repeat 1 (TTC1) [Fusarium beomiforme]
MSTIADSKDDVVKPTDVEKAKDNASTADGQELKFTPEEEEALVKESTASKEEANTLFAAKKYQDALDKYDDAINSCPKYLHYPRAVIYSNIAACHIQLEDWKEAIKAASDSLKALEKLEQSDPRLNPDGKKAEEEKGEKDEDVEEEIISSGASRAAPASTMVDQELETLKANIQRIRCKALMRRARGRSEAGGWHNLAGAEEDCKALAARPESLAPADLRVVRKQIRELPPRVKAAQEKEMGEMWGKLKDLGNGILKPFGLSTNNFQMVKDEKTGGYSMNFQPGGSS